MRYFTNRSKNVGKKLVQPTTSRLTRQRYRYGKRQRISDGTRNRDFLPPENWYEPREERSGDFQVVIQSPGPGYRHAVSEEDVRIRLAKLPDWMIENLEVVQLSRMTRKKKTFPCYGMQWGNAIYLYPIEVSLVEEFQQPPKPAVYNEVRMYGGRWERENGYQWRLCWTEESLANYYLNNILMHELGHLLDDRNTNIADRERYAEWFAIEHGYRAEKKNWDCAAKVDRPVRRRHHSC
jgi:hypothetical protein